MMGVRRVIPAVVVIVTTATVVAAAATSQGFHARKVSLNDGSIWTSQANSSDPGNPGSYIGRANPGAGLVDTALVATARPQLLQDGPHVVFHDAAGGAVTSVDVDLGVEGAALSVPPLVAPQGTVAAGTPVGPDGALPAVDLNTAGEVGLGADTVGVVDQGTGKVYVFPADALPAGPVAAQRSVATLAKGSRLVVDDDGVTHVVTPAGEVDDFSATGARLRRSSIGTDLTKVTTPGSPFTVTAVGSRAVVLDGSGKLYVEGHQGAVGMVGDAGSAGDGTANGVAVVNGPLLQQPGGVRPGVLVATGSALVSVNLASGANTVLSTAGVGTPAAPVFVPERGCAYGAWTGRAAVPADASTSGSPAVGPIAAIVCDNGRHYQGAGEPNPVWRVNHGSALLNDELSGDNLFFDGLVPLRIDDWTQAQRPSKGQQTAAATGTTLTEQKQSDPSTVDHPPKAFDDNLATRPGVPLIAHVLANDTDADGDVLAVTGLSDLPTGGASASIIDGGNDIQVTPGIGLTPVTFAYQIDDGRGGTSAAHVTVAIHPLSQNGAPLVPGNEPPVSVDAGAHVTVDLLRDATDPDGDALTLTSATLPTGAGSVEFTAAGLAVVSPSTVGSTVLSFTVSDGHGGVTQGSQMITVSPPLTPLVPETHDDHLQVVVGVAGTVDVLANDIDGDNAPLSLTHVDSPAGLTVVQLGGGILGITAATVGTTLVHYTASDGTSQSTSTLRVDAIQSDPSQRVIAVRDDATLRPGAPTVVPVLNNDIDQAGSVLVIDGLANVPPGLSVSQIDHGALTISSEQALASPETFTYTAGDGVASATGTVVVRPAPGGVDQPPVTAPATASVREGNAIPIDVLAHDFDPEGEALTLVSVAPLPATQGNLFVEAGQLRYVAPQTPLGAVSGTYVVKDSFGNASTGSVVIHVLAADATNHPPQPPDVVARVYTGKPVTVVLPLLGIDPDGDVTTLVSVSPPTLGSQVLGTLSSPLGLDRFTFTAGTTGGTQQLTYQVRDSGGLLATGAIRIGIVAPPAQNSPPVALPDLVSLAPGTLRRVSVLKNDSDPDGDPLTLDPSQLTKPSGGQAVIDGSMIDVTAPVAVRDGTKLSFSYGISDGRGGSASSTVTETVTAHPALRPPLAVDDLVAPQGTGSTVRVNVLANDTISNGTSAQATVAVPGLPHATVAGGTVSFTMPATPLSFAYTVTDGAGQSASAVVTVPLAAGQPPVAGPDAATTDAGKPVTIDVLANDHDPAGLPLSVAKIANSSGGTADVVGRQVRFSPAGGFTGLGGFSYVLSDGRLSSVGTAVVTVGSTTAKTPSGSQDHVPVTVATSLRVPAGGAVSVDLANLASDPDAGDKLSFGSLTGGGTGIHGSLSGSTLTVSADTAARGASASFGYSVSDGHPKGTAAGTVGVAVVSSTKPLPQALPDVMSTLQGVPVTIPVLANDVDPLGLGLHLVSVTGGGADGTAVIAGQGLTVTPTAAFHGVISLTYVMADKSGDALRQATGVVRLTVVGKPDAPGNPSGSANSHQVQLTWAVPSANGGTITGYTVNWAGGSQACPLNACLIVNLANNHDYQFTVTAADEAGSSPPSAPSIAIHVDKIPDVPQAPTGVSGDQKIAVTWPVPDADGSAPTSYDVLMSPGGAKMTVSQPMATFAGLTNGTAYTFTVDATNKAGSTDFSTASAPVTPAGVPATPSAPNASTTPDAKTAVATWSAPDSNGSPITSYTLEVFENGTLRSTIMEKDTSNRTDTVPATNGDTYAFAVSATNAVGTTPYSPKSNVVTATGRPDQVGTVTATGGNASASLSWSAPSNNGSAITSYTVYPSTGGSRSFPTAGGTYNGLTNGQSYTFAVSACNSVGCGAESNNSNSVTPFTTPDAPTASSNASDMNSIQWQWTTPNSNGATITGYAYSVDGGGSTSTSANNVTVPGFACNSTHSLVVHAVNKAGNGPNSNSVQVLTQPCPAPPAPSASISATDGGKGTHQSGSCNGNCHTLNFTVANFPTGKYTWTCNDSAGTYYNSATYGYTVNVTSSGQSFGGTTADYCLDTNQNVTIEFDGITSNSVHLGSG